MTITSIPTYVTTADEFIAHATDVNADRVANTLPELVWPGGYLLADFEADRDALDAKITELVGLENALEQAIDNRDKENGTGSIRFGTKCAVVYFCDGGNASTVESGCQNGRDVVALAGEPAAGLNDVQHQAARAAGQGHGRAIPLSCFAMTPRRAA